MPEPKDLRIDLPDSARVCVRHFTDGLTLDLYGINAKVLVEAIRQAIGTEKLIQLTLHKES